MSKKLQSYKGKLSFAQIAEGMTAALENAARLTQDARLLLEAGRIPTACSLAALSIEESGKVSILRAMSLARNDAELKEEWKRYRSHTNKNVQWIFPQLVAEGARKLDDFRSLFDKGAEHPYLLDQIKQLGFYTDCLGSKGHWSIPDKVIDGELAEQLVATAELLSSASPTSEREVELWVEQVGPFWKKELSWMKSAVANWYEAMQREGLKPDGKNGMEKFLDDGVNPEDV
ncbi:AbiV family abortive infection protein [Marinimicrobium koreense]|uniref:AbiV family abortive infection protein n=1 Tax=Marinimicrobium koreense TaxID=306545 RepID=A0A3N1P1B7_9GAMM|nr:AbiV family abortive infection protein [Marinimicrobium koreense]ROQ18676.1 AbiV family abortive infection protein [Marinimicrobium koreense]